MNDTFPPLTHDQAVDLAAEDAHEEALAYLDTSVDLLHRLPASGARATALRQLGALRRQWTGPTLH